MWRTYWECDKEHDEDVRGIGRLKKDKWKRWGERKAEEKVVKLEVMKNAKLKCQKNWIKRCLKNMTKTEAYKIKREKKLDEKKNENNKES